MEYAAVEIGDLFGSVNLAKIAEVVETLEQLAGLAHLVNVEPAFPHVGRRRSMVAAGRAWHGCKTGVGEEVLVAALFAGEAGGEIGRRVGTPGVDADVGREDAVEQLDVGELVLGIVECSALLFLCVLWLLLAIAPQLHAHNLAEGTDTTIGTATLGILASIPVDFCAVPVPPVEGLAVQGRIRVGLGRSPGGGTDQTRLDQGLPQLLLDSRQRCGIVCVVLEPIVLLAEVGKLEGDETGGVSRRVEGLWWLLLFLRLDLGRRVACILLVLDQRQRLCLCLRLEMADAVDELVVRPLLVGGAGGGGGGGGSGLGHWHGGAAAAAAGGRRLPQQDAPGHSRELVEAATGAAQKVQLVGKFGAGAMVGGSDAPHAVLMAAVTDPIFFFCLLHAGVTLPAPHSTYHAQSTHTLSNLSTTLNNAQLNNNNLQCAATPIFYICNSTPLAPPLNHPPSATNHATLRLPPVQAAFRQPPGSLQPTAPASPTATATPSRLSLHNPFSPLPSSCPYPLDSIDDWCLD